MKLRVYNETPEQEAEKEIFFQLQQDGEDVNLVALDKNGEYLGAVLYINKAGLFRFRASLGDKTGLPRDPSGAILMPAE